MDRKEKCIVNNDNYFTIKFEPCKINYFNMKRVY